MQKTENLNNMDKLRSIGFVLLLVNRMHLSSNETQKLLKITASLSSSLDPDAIRELVAQDLLELLRADCFASYIWDPATEKFGRRVALNMAADNLSQYERYYQFCDPITLKLQQQKSATLVSQIMPQRELVKTEFFNDFLYQDRLYYGINLFAYDGDLNIGDWRIWRYKNRPNFDAREAQILNLLQPHFVNALRNSRVHQQISAFPADQQLAQFEFLNGSLVGQNESAIAFQEKTPIGLFNGLMKQIKLIAKSGKSTGSFGIYSISIRRPQTNISRFVATVYSNPKTSVDSRWIAAAFGLTKREAEIVLLLIQGDSDQEVAQKLTITFHTVRTHIKNIFKKLNVTNRSELNHLILSPMMHIKH